MRFPRRDEDFPSSRSGPSGGVGGGGGSSSRRPFKLARDSHRRIDEEEPLYEGAIFRFTCYGHLHLSSENKDGGKCHGYHTQFQKIRGIGPGTRSSCIQKFVGQYHPASALMPDHDAASSSSSTPTATDQQIKEIYSSRSIIYKEPSSPANKNSNNNKSGSSLVRKVHHRLPEEDLIEKTEWKQYGSTQVDLLVLQPLDPSWRIIAPPLHKALLVRKQDEGTKAITDSAVSSSSSSTTNTGNVTAITSENWGVSIKHIDSQIGHFTVTDFGPVRICLETSSSAIPTDSMKDQEDSNKNHHQQQQQEQQQELPPPTTIVDPWKFVPKVYNFSGKVVRRMQTNVRLLQEATSDDFPNRTVRFGKKFLDQLEKTTQKTAINLAKTIRSFWRDL